MSSIPRRLPRPCAQVCLAAALFALALGACAEDRHLPLREVRCQTDLQCRRGAFCRDGICAATPSRPADPEDAGGDVIEIDRGVLEEIGLPFEPAELPTPGRL